MDSSNYSSTDLTLRPAHPVNQMENGAYWIADDANLASQCDQWQKNQYLALDTEFVRTRTYFAQLGLIQVSDGEKIWLIDATAISDWVPFAAVFANLSVEKIIHSGGEDLQLFNQVVGQLPQPLFDTQIAATLAGVGGTLSYQRLVGELMDIEVEKDQTRSNWLKRPLTPQQCRYAADDVRYLVQCTTQLQSRLEELGRDAWNREENQSLLDPNSLEPSVDDLYARFGASWKMNDEQRSRLWRICDWRENLARQRDLPRTWLIKNPAIGVLAQRPPDNLGALSRIDGVDPRTVRHYGAELLELLQEPALVPPPVAAPKPLNAEQRVGLKERKVQVEKLADELDLPMDFLLPRKKIEHWIRGASIDEISQGWRREVLRSSFTGT